MSGLVLLLPLPPTSNHRMILVHGRNGRPARLVLSPEHRDWKTEAVRAIKEQLPAGFAPFRQTVELNLEQVADTLASDVSNRVKTLEDALTEAGVWGDDRQVGEIHEVGRRFTRPGEEAYVAVVIRAANPVVHAERNRRLAESEVRAEKAALKPPKPRKPKAKKVNPRLERFMARFSPNVRGAP